MARQLFGVTFEKVVLRALRIHFVHTFCFSQTESTKTVVGAVFEEGRKIRSNLEPYLSSNRIPPSPKIGTGNGTDIPSGTAFFTVLKGANDFVSRYTGRIPA